MNSLADSVMIVRTIHFAATAMTTGALIFQIVVAEPALRSSESVARAVQTRIAVIQWGALAIAIGSGVIWFLLQATAMSGLSFSKAMTADVLLTVLNETQFGWVSGIRLVLAVVLAACLTFVSIPWVRWPAIASAISLMVSIAWTGHAASTLGSEGLLHLLADALHLLASAAWLGGLIPLALLLTVTRRYNGCGWMSLTRGAIQRFSILGILSVGTLVATGVVNAWILVGSFHVLMVTEYGRLLTMKLMFFALLLAIAAVNRFWLTPRFALSAENALSLEAAHKIARNSIIEFALGVVIFAIVGALGTLHPAAHFIGL